MRIGGLCNPTLNLIEERNVKREFSKRDDVKDVKDFLRKRDLPSYTNALVSTPRPFCLPVGDVWRVNLKNLNINERIWLAE